MSMLSDLPPRGETVRIASRQAVSADRRRDWLRGVLEHTVAGVFAIDRGLIQQPTRGVQSVAQARQVAMYLAHVGLGLSMRDTGNLFERDRTTVAHAVRMIEEKREHACFDHAMSVLEYVVRELAREIDDEEVDDVA
jgi:chromosomal replication initiation ATPase DnaA